MAVNSIRIKETSARLEDLLATDDLFVEYFNAFLALPTFPEPLLFNKETGGFEVFTDAKHRLAEEIKAVVRAGRRRKKIYRPVRNNAFTPIPLIPMEEPPLLEEKEIDTSFSVKTLNKEQGIEWVKAERLPLFLESDCYTEYRLAHLVSQAQVAKQPGEYVTMRLDYTPHVKKEEVPEVEEEEDTEDKEIQSLMKDMYVSMGNTSTTDTDAWVSVAKLAHQPVTTTSSGTCQSRPVSALMPSGGSQVGGSRPISAISNPDSYLRVDSGVWSMGNKDSVNGNALDYTMANSVMSVWDQESECGQIARSPGSNAKGITPRPSDTVFLSAEEYKPGSSLPKSPVYCKPPSEVFTPGSGRLTANGSPVEQADYGNILVDDTQEVSISGNPSVDELGTFIVGTALRNAMAELTGEKPEQGKDYPNIHQIHNPYTNLTKAQLDKPGYSIAYGGEKSTGKDSGATHALGETTHESTPAANDKNGPILTNQVQAKEHSQESDEDSLLNSDDDYDHDRDQFFRRHKARHRVTLKTKKGIEEFKNFLLGTVGEKNWSFWLDVDRLRYIQNDEDSEHIINYMAALRERYHRYGTRLELSQETKLELGLVEPTQWTKDKVLAVQDRMAEPLVLYWAPRFLLKQDLKPRPESNLLYHNQSKLCPPPDPCPSPSPPVATLLPLRPKTCIPRLHQQQPQEIQISPAFDSNSTQSDCRPNTSCDFSHTTSPTIGMRRVHTLLDTQNEKSLKGKNDIKRPPSRQKRPKELITALLQLENTDNDKEPHPPGTPSRERSKSKQALEAWETSSAMLSSASTADKPSSRSLLSKSLPGSRSGSRLGSRPGSAVSLADSTNLSEISDFAGGRRMEGLLQALHNERKAGEAFRKFLSRQDDEVWKNCLGFWKDVQQFHSMFYTEILDVFTLEKKSKAVYAQYIVEGAPYPIGCSKDIKETIYSRIEPPFEDLFDPAEEYVLEVLFQAWSQMLVTDLSTFDKVELIEVKRRLDAKSKYVVSLQRRGIIKDQGEAEDDLMEGYEDPVYDPSLMERIPEEFRDYSLGKLIHNRLELEHFRNFLADNYASMDLMCWMDIEAFKRIPHTDEHRRDGKARDIKAKYFTKKYFFGPNSPAGKEGQEKIVDTGGGWGKMLGDRAPTIVIMEVQSYVGDRLEKKWLPLFVASPEFAERQKPKVGVDDAVEDIMIQKKKKSHAIWRMLESKWVSSSQDILTFRKALLNPVTSMQFRKFVSIRGDHFENDVLFWQEVQKYKELCHLHADRSLVQQKTFAIIHCFIDSPIPPSLQIDITPDMAELIVDRKNEMAPYLFREAQLMVFRMLFEQWTDFCSFRDNLTKDKIIPTIERHRRRARFEEKKKKRVLEEKRAKEDARRRALGLPPEGGDDEDYDPFKEDSEEEADRQMRRNKDAVGWSYSHYMQALQEEEVLNEVDFSTFSSVAAPRSEISSPYDLETEASTLGSRHSSEPKQPKKDPKKPVRLDVRRMSETSSKCKSDVRSKSAQSAHRTEAQPPLKQKEFTKTVSPTDPKPKLEKVPGAAVPRLTFTTPSNEPNKERQRLSRRMPPLVSKK